MFQDGFFSSVENQPYRVDGIPILLDCLYISLTLSFLIVAGLAKVTAERTGAAMQVSNTNPMTGLEGRASLLFNLSKALIASPQFFGQEGRPGNLIGPF
jgi:hypothetical protein